MCQGMGVSCMRYILREFLGHNFVSGLRTLKPKKLNTFSLKNLGFSSPELNWQAARVRMRQECTEEIRLTVD